MHDKLGVPEIKMDENHYRAIKPSLTGVLHGISFQTGVSGLINVNLGVLDMKKFEKHFCNLYVSWTTAVVCSMTSRTGVKLQHTYSCPQHMVMSFNRLLSVSDHWAKAWNNDLRVAFLFQHRWTSTMDRSPITKWTKLTLKRSIGYVCTVKWSLRTFTVWMWQTKKTSLSIPALVFFTSVQEFFRDHIVFSWTSVRRIYNDYSQAY